MAFKRKSKEKGFDLKSDLTNTVGAFNSAVAKSASSNAIANLLPFSGNAIMNSYKSNKKRTFNDLLEASKLAKESNKEEKNIRANQNLSQEVFDAAVASSNLMQNLYSNSKDTPSYLNTTDKSEVKRDITQSEKNNLDMVSRMYSPYLGAIEKLGIEDYYPTIGQNIQVGSYSGRRIGSMSIFEGGGLVLPMGLVDARKRALQGAASEQQKAIDKILEIPDTSEQYNQKFKELAMNEIYSGLESVGWDANKFMKNRDLAGMLYRYQTTAEAITNVDNIFDDLIEKHVKDDGTIGSYIPEDFLKFMYDFRDGKLENMEDYLTGKKNVSEVLKYAKDFADATVMVDEKIPTFLANPRELPISLKTGVRIDESAIKQINEALQKSKGSGFDVYKNALSKFYDFKIDEIVDTWMTDAGYSQDDPARKNVKDYFWAQIPGESIEQKIQFQSNKDFEYYKYNKEEEKKMALWESVLYKYDKANTEKAILDNLENIRSSSDKSKALAEVYNGLELFKGLGFKASIDPNNPKLVRGKISVANNDRYTPATVQNDRATMYVNIREWDATKKRWVNKGADWVPISSIAEAQNTISYDEKGGIYSYGKYEPVNAGRTEKRDASGKITEIIKDKDVDDDFLKMINASTAGSLDLSAYEYAAAAAYTSGGVAYELTSDNLGSYEKAKDKTVKVTVYANPNLTYEGEDGEVFEAPSKLKVKFVADLESTADRSTLEVMNKEKQSIRKGYTGEE